MPCSAVPLLGQVLSQLWDARVHPRASGLHSFLSPHWGTIGPLNIMCVR